MRCTLGTAAVYALALLRMHCQAQAREAASVAHQAAHDVGRRSVAVGRVADLVEHAAQLHLGRGEELLLHVTCTHAHAR